MFLGVKRYFILPPCFQLGFVVETFDKTLKNVSFVLVFDEQSFALFETSDFVSLLLLIIRFYFY